MTTGWKYARPAKEKLMTLEEPGKELLFDADKGLVDEVSAKFNLSAIAQGLKGKSEEQAYKAMEKLGKEVMDLTIKLGDGKYLDRTGEMIERVFKQTGISFPHRFQRYLELSILGMRPTDRWSITRSTTKEVVLQVSSCSIKKALEETGVGGLPCKGFCLASFEAAAAKTGDQVHIEMTRTLPQEGMCQFHFRV
jgi:hypothetical protein